MTEDQKTDIIFNGEYLYKNGGGHSFLRGFFVEYLTKSGVRVTQYLSGLWSVGADDYTRDEEGNFIKKEYPPYVPTPTNAWESISLPMVRNVKCKDY